MQTPIEAVFDGMGFDEAGEWHKGSFLDFWRWSFSDLEDEAAKGIAAELISKLLLGVGPLGMTAEELQILRSSSVAASALESTDAGWAFDA